MKWIIFSFTLLIFTFRIWCQDIVFPNDEEMSHVSGNKAEITERLPVMIPGRCPENMLLYPGDGHVSAWICDCRPRFLYFPLNNSCHEAYMRGPCLPKEYVVLPLGESVPKCEKNPCLEDGLVQYNNTCYGLKTSGGPCAPDGVLGVNETTFEIECIPNELVLFNIIDAPTNRCPAGSRRNSLGVCRKMI
ncbi:uncharacterized protein LOC107262868 [Cephus cinctus]|uniref:Uncharacterized protein LOC107262868 n=1 Tax=Cephus cinctus TaxID=211228 RepID=A0AAJ7FCG1_CEPCN|nr:uncharacterized protein LOC107262868 [Cephus cinctus]